MRILRFAFGNWFSRIYLLIVVVVGLVVTISVATWDGPDANFIGVWIIFLTLPFSFLTVAVDSIPTALFVAGIAISAMVNAILIGMVVSLVDRRGRGRPVTVEQ